MRVPAGVRRCRRLGTLRFSLRREGDRFSKFLALAIERIAPLSKAIRKVVQCRTGVRAYDGALLPQNAHQNRLGAFYKRHGSPFGWAELLHNPLMPVIGQRPPFAQAEKLLVYGHGLMSLPKWTDACSGQARRPGLRAGREPAVRAYNRLARCRSGAALPMYFAKGRRRARLRRREKQSECPSSFEDCLQFTGPPRQAIIELNHRWRVAHDKLCAT